jgi:hypothetical protein
VSRRRKLNLNASLRGIAAVVALLFAFVAFLMVLVVVERLVLS